VIRVAHLTKRYGAHLAVDDVSFEVGSGEIVGLLGPNGAGKTTLLRTLAGVLGPTSGAVVVGDHDVVRESFEARRCVGYMPEATPLYVEMRVVEYLRFRAELKRVPRATRRTFVDEAMEKAGVLDVANRQIAHLSKGYRQRVGIADALVAKPPIVILDEPTAGLDPNQIRQTRALVRELGRAHTVVVSTHILSEIEACATRVLLLHRGKLVAEGPMDAIRSLRDQKGASVEIALRGEAETARTAAARVAGVARVSATSDPATGLVRLQVTFEDAASAEIRAQTSERIVAALVAAGLGVREVRPAAGSLEDVFALLTTADATLERPGPGESDLK
jgi:ABC-2 type transport system ATP-binding protein